MGREKELDKVTLEELYRWKAISDNSPSFHEIAKQILPAFIDYFIELRLGAKQAVDYIKELNQQYIKGRIDESSSTITSETNRTREDNIS